MCVGHLAKKGGFQLCCGIAGVKKLTKGHLEIKNKKPLKCIFSVYPPFIYSHDATFNPNPNLTEVCLTGGGTVLYRTQKTAAIKPISLKITRAVKGANNKNTEFKH